MKETIRDAAIGVTFALAPPCSVFALLFSFSQDDPIPSLLVAALCAIAFLCAYITSKIFWNKKKPTDDTLDVPQEEHPPAAPPIPSTSEIIVPTTAPTKITSPEIQPLPPKQLLNPPSVAGPIITQVSNIIGMRPVISSNVESIGFDEGSLYICFHSNKDDRVYRYYDVPIEVFFALLYAPSVGKFYNSTIKKQYKGERIKDKGAIPHRLTQLTTTHSDRRTRHPSVSVRIEAEEKAEKVHPSQ